MRLGINYKKKKKTVKTQAHWGLNSMLLNNKQATEEIKREIKKFLETTMKTRQLKTYQIRSDQSLSRVQLFATP